VQDAVVTVCEIGKQKLRVHSRWQRCELFSKKVYSQAKVPVVRLTENRLTVCVWRKIRISVCVSVWCGHIVACEAKLLLVSVTENRFTVCVWEKIRITVCMSVWQSNCTQTNYVFPYEVYRGLGRDCCLHEDSLQGFCCFCTLVFISQSQA